MMVYMGPESHQGEVEGRSPPFIAPGLCVAKGGADTSGGSFSYWPRYSDTALIARATYLVWLDQRINRK